MRVLILLSRVPYPLEKGDRLRAYHQIKILKQSHEIHLVCLSDEPVSPDQRSATEAICNELTIIKLSKLKIAWNLGLSLFGRQPFQVKYFYQKSGQRKVNNIIARFKPEHIYCQLIRTTEYVKQHFEIPKTLDYMDALNMGMLRRVNRAPWWKRELIRIEGLRLQEYEHLVFDYFDKHTIISEQDKQLILHPEREKIQVVPNGVDYDFFQPQQKDAAYDLAFTGNMSYPPNVESAVFLVEKILPLILEKRPGTTVLLAGVNPHPKVKALASSQVHVSGWMEDIRDAYAQARVFIAPLQIGTGLQNKLLEAMSMAKPCITSKLANNALQASNGEELFVCQHPAEYAEKVLHFLDDESSRRAMGAKARAFILEHYSWASTTSELNSLFNA